MKLNEIKLDIDKIIKTVGGEDTLRRRLLDLGFIPGATIRCVLVSPFKDPRAYLINNNVIALRNKDAKVVEVL